MSSKHQDVVYHGGGSDSVYGLGMIGAWVYYIGKASTPRQRAIGFLKGLVWPAFLVYEVLKFFGGDLPVKTVPAPAESAPILRQAPASEKKPSRTTKTRSAVKPVRGGKPKTRKTARK